METNVAAIMTAPRYECTWARNIIQAALRKNNIPLTVSGGVFYGQCMQTMIENCILAGNIDYVITVDFDSVFVAADIQRLMHWIMTRDDIDAITGLQIRRGKQSMLGTIPDGEYISETDKRIAWDGNPIRGTTAHFGLTVLNLKKFEKLPKPWFISKPDVNGSWTGDGKIDDDVHFWFNWKEAGNSVYFDPGVRLGHLEEMVTVYDEDLNPMHMYPKDWEEMAKKNYDRGTN